MKEIIEKQLKELKDGIEETKSVLYRQLGAIAVLESILAEDKKPKGK